MRRVLGLIADASALSEREVTRATLGVTQFYEEACSHSKSLQAAAGTLTDTGVPDLAAVSAEFHAAVSERLREQMHAIDRSLESLELIRTLARDMELLTRSAKLMGVNLRIEAARLGDAGRTIEAGASSWSDFADDMAQLNRRVTTVAGELLENFPRAHRIATEVLDLAESEAIKTADAFGVIREQIHGKHLALVQSTEDAASAAHRIRNTADSVLTSLQFQDRMRQLHAHAERDLREIARNLAISLPAPTNVHPAPVMSQDVDPDVESGEIEFF